LWGYRPLRGKGRSWRLEKKCENYIKDEELPDRPAAPAIVRMTWRWVMLIIFKTELLGPFKHPVRP
jgi:hypothetical protein